VIDARFVAPRVTIVMVVRLTDPDADARKVDADALRQR
jgi:hypothetical protein